MKRADAEETRIGKGYSVPGTVPVERAGHGPPKRQVCYASRKRISIRNLWGLKVVLIAGKSKETQVRFCSRKNLQNPPVFLPKNFSECYTHARSSSCYIRPVRRRRRRRRSHCHRRRRQTQPGLPGGGFEREREGAPYEEYKKDPLFSLSSYV